MYFCANIITLVVVPYYLSHMFYILYYPSKESKYIVITRVVIYNFVCELTQAKLIICKTYNARKHVFEIEQDGILIHR